MKDYIVVTTTEEGSEMWNRGFKQAVWGHFKTKKRAVEVTEAINKNGRVKAWIEIKEK